MVNGVYSEYNTITHGVPQGSVLGPVLFLLYINDVTNVIGPHSIYLYADDTVLLESSDNGEDVQARLQDKLDSFVEWCNSNKLTLNTKKNKAINFQLEKQHAIFNGLQYMVGDQTLDVYSYKYLGYLIDYRLDFNLMFEQLLHKLNYKIYLLAKLRPLAVYRSKILSYIDYMFYSSFRKPMQRKLQVIQNRAIRIICRIPKRTNVDRRHI